MIFFLDQMRSRWKRQQELFLDTVISSNSRSYTHEKNKKWTNIIELCSEQETSNRVRYESMEDIHIFALANILSRPIIVLCERIYRSEEGSSLQSLRLGGIYLPLIRGPKECEKSPIVLGFKDDHFFPLISVESISVPFIESVPLETAIHCVPLFIS